MSLNKVGGGRQKDKSKVISIDLQANNAAVKTAIDHEL